MLKVERRTIGEHEYVVTQLDAVRGRRVFTRAAKLFAPALATAIGGSDKKTPEILEGRVLDALSKLLEGLQEDDVDFFCDAFASSTEVTLVDEKGRRTPKLSTIFSLHFAGNYEEMFRWLLFAFEVNFGSFFDKVGFRLGATKAPAVAEASK